MVFHYNFFVLILALSERGGVYSLKVFISSKKWDILAHYHTKNEKTS